MNAHADTIDPAAHHALRELLPWFAADSLGAAEQAAVQAHLADCAACRAEAAWQRELHLAAALAEPEEDDAARADAALARLQPMLREGTAPAGWRTGLVACARWMAAVPAVPVACALAVALLLAEAPQPAYTTLGDAAAGGGDTAVVFRPATTAAEVHRILAASGAAVVRGPTVTGAYMLRVAPDRREATLARLRTEPTVLLAEPLDRSIPPGASR